MRSKTSSEQKAQEIVAYLETLYSLWGPQHWWPADSPFEVIVGAILTQNTAWTNVEKALKNLREGGVLSVDGIRRCSLEHLEQMIRPAGYFRQKAARLKRLAGWLDSDFQGSPEKLFEVDTKLLRDKLLSLNGVGPETADSILLYGGQKEVFVVDAYTRRIFERHRIIRAGAKYDEIRLMVEDALRHSAINLRHSQDRRAKAAAVEPGPGPAEELPAIVVHPPSRMSEHARSDLARRYNEFHALLVQTAKHYCQSRVAKCETCPLRPFLRTKVLVPPPARPSRRRKNVS